MLESPPGDVRSGWAEQYRAQGYLNIPDLLPPATVRGLQAAFDELERQGTLRVGEEELVDHTDIIFLHEAFASVLREPRVVALLTALLGPSVELYDTKFINKPLRAMGFSSFAWHQDFAFYPHTNHDLLAFAIHLDDEDERSGPVRLLPGSHRLGPLPHCQDGQFLHRLARVPPEAERDSVLLTGRAGFVTVHHCLTVHCSDPKERYGHRRIAYYDVRAQDNAQLAGYLRRSAGWEVTPRPPGESRYARFPDESRIELRGASGRLCDPFGLLASGRGHSEPET
jgi:phytanoyl-CoA hydroxylase